MADETLTGAKQEISVDTEQAEKRKKIIKYVILVAVAVGVFFLVKKYVLKK